MTPAPTGPATGWLPAVRAGVDATPLGEATLVFDTAATRVHVLSPTATPVFRACAQGLSREELLGLLHHATGEPVDRLDRDVDSALDQFRRQGLLTGEPHETAPTPPRMEVATAVAGPPPVADAPRFSVLGRVVAVHAHDRRLLTDVRRVLADLITDEPATAALVVEVGGDGSVRTAGDRWPLRTWASADALLDQLPTLLNLLTPHVSDALVLHAGAVASADGGVVVIAGDSGAGKSTLTAAMVQRGWTYLSDEAVGVRPGTLTAVAYPKPLALAAGARRALGLPPGPSHTSVSELGRSARAVPAAGVDRPVRAVVLPHRRPGAATLDPVPPGQRAAVAIAPHALNLPVARLPALEALAGLALLVPVFRLGHAGVESDVTEVIATVVEADDRPVPRRS